MICNSTPAPACALSAAPRVWKAEDRMTRHYLLLAALSMSGLLIILTRILGGA